MASDKERDPGASSAEIGKYLDILAKDPNSRVFAPLAEAYRKAGLFDDAVETALEGLKAHPNYLGGRVALGRAYFEKKRYAEAADEMQKVAKAAPDNIIAHKVLGQIAYAQSDLHTAEQAFKMVLLLDPRDQEAQQFIANLAGGAVAAPAVVQPPSLPVPLTMPLPMPLPMPAPVTSALERPLSSPMPAPAPQPLPAAPRPPSATPPLTTPPAPPPSATPPFDDIQSIEDLDLQADIVIGGSSDEPLPTAAAPAAGLLEDPGEDEPLDMPEPDSWLPEPVSVAPPPPPGQQPEADGGIELEVFSRVRWESNAEREVAPPPPAPAVIAAEAESPFEVFGRPKNGGPPPSTRGGQVAFGEINLETAADEPEPGAPAPAADSDSPFEIFTREPGLSVAPVKSERSGAAGPREVEIETTAYTPPDIFIPPDVAAPAPILDDELPSIDLMQDVDLDSPMDASPAPLEPRSPATTLPPEPAAAPIEMQGEEPLAWAEPDQAVRLQDEPPPVGAAEQTHRDDLEEEYAEEYEELLSAAEPPGTAASRGVFDTETLASIYVKQGFYGRAAEIYQRLITQNPADPGLRSKLESVLAQARAEVESTASVMAAAAEPLAPAATIAPAPGAPLPDASRAGPERMIGQLQTLLEAFKGGRPL